MTSNCLPNGVIIDQEYIPVGAHLRVRPITSGDRENEKDIQKPVMGNQPTLPIINRHAPAARPTRPRGKTLTAGCRITLYPAPIIIKKSNRRETMSKTTPTKNPSTVFNPSNPSNPSAPSNTFKFRKKKEYTTPKGEKVTGKYLEDKHKARQSICETFVPRAKKLAEQLLNFREEVIENLRKYSAWNAAKYKVTPGDAGNISVTSFDGKMRVEVHSHPDVDYDSQAIEVAKTLMGNVIDENTNGVTQVLRKLFMDAFTPTKQGLSLVSITTLMTYKVPDPRWDTAVKALSEGRQVVNRSFYVEISVKNEENKWQKIPLDIAKVTPMNARVK